MISGPPWLNETEISVKIPGQIPILKRSDTQFSIRHSFANFESFCLQNITKKSKLNLLLFVLIKVLCMDTLI